MNGIHVSNEQLGQLRPPSQAEIERSIERAQWSPAREATHARNMQQLMQTVQQFAEMSPAARKEATQEKIAAQGTAQAQGKHRVSENIRHNSVARGGYTASQGNSATRTQQNRVPIHPSVQKHRDRNMRKQARANRRQQLRQRFKQAVKSGVRQAGRWTARQPQRMARAVGQLRLHEQRQHLTHQARDKMMTPPEKSQSVSRPKHHQQTAERTIQLNTAPQQTPERFVQQERSNQQRQLTQKKEQQRGPQHTR